MNPQIMSLLLVLLLSISITACSNNKSSSNSASYSVVSEAYKAVLQNKVDFISTDGNKKKV
jgi:hypothetical protein